MTIDFTRVCTGAGRSIALALVTLLLAACGHAPNPDQGDGVATLKWQAPTEYENGDPLTDLAAYVILYGRSPEDLRYWRRVEDASQTSTVITGLGKGEWFFTILAVDGRGIASSQAALVSKVIQ